MLALLLTEPLIVWARLSDLPVRSASPRTELTTVGARGAAGPTKRLDLLASRVGAVSDGGRAGSRAELGFG